MHIRPLSGDQVKQFVHNWYRIVEKGLAKDPEQAESIARQKAESLIQRLQEPEFRARRVFELTRNPLLLTNICLVHRHRGELPRKRAWLYQECIDVLLEHWREGKHLRVGVSAEDGRRVLQPAALWLHREEGRTRAKAAELAPHIEPALQAVNWSGGSTGNFLRTIRDESGLLTGWDQEHYGFMHLGFQEYLAAREIRRRAQAGDHQILRELASHFGESWWQEVGLLLVGLDDPSLFTPYMREVVCQPAFAAFPNLVEMVLDDAAETSPQPFVELLETACGRDRQLSRRFMGLVQRPFRGSWVSGKNQELWQRQLVALQVLERLDADAVERLVPGLAMHPSPSIRNWLAARRERVRQRSGQTLQDVLFAEPGGYELVRIPAGVFMMGSSQREEGRRDSEGPQHEVLVPDFYMGRYPVTNEQYAQFLKENSKAAAPKYWADRSLNQPRQPVVGVSWEDARDYAAWAGLRLPSEAEWEYACRARTITPYYTGDTETDLDRAAWYIENSGNGLHPVGEKEPNGFGLYDMHGNVWEWTEDDWHRNYEGAPTDGRAWVDSPQRGSGRVIRGGGWRGVARFCRSAVRGNGVPGVRGSRVGFRLSRSVALGP